MYSNAGVINVTILPERSKAVLHEPPRLTGDEVHPKFAGFWGRREFDREMIAALPKVRAFAYKLAKSAADRDDLVQDACVMGLKAWESFTPGTNMGAWLCFIARNKFYSDKRRAWRWSELPDEFAVMIPCETNAHHRLELQDALAALSYLQPAMRDVILAAAEGLSMEEMAEEFEVSDGTIKSRLSRGRAMLDIYFSASRG